MANPLHSLTTYSYVPLERPRSFRLLRFMPNGGNPSHIHCTIEHFDRGSDPCPPYTALSYAWGKVKTTVPITLNGQLAFVTENLRDALLHLRRVRPDTLLWVDALSINQDDPSERGHQVSQMRAIYSEASNVISWLGQGTVNGMSRLFTFIKNHHNDCTLTSGSTERCEFVVDRELADALRYLEERPYWNRIWVIQEIVVATVLEVMCGDESVSWFVFSTFWREIFTDHFRKAPGMNRRLAPPIHSSAVLPLISWRRTNIDLSYAIQLTGLSRATDGRDKVYALLGLVDKGAGQHIVVDYTVSPCVVFLAATQALIRDWNAEEEDARKQRLQALLSQINTEPTSGQRFKNYSAGSRASPIAECETVAYLRQHVRFLLGDSDYLVMDMLTSSTEPEGCDGERCGSWVAMYKAATIQEDDSKRPWGWAVLGLHPAIV